jgi:hypothetical protein
MVCIKRDRPIEPGVSPPWLDRREISWLHHLPSLYKREEFSLFGKEGSGKIFGETSFFNYRLFSNRRLIQAINMRRESYRGARSRDVIL